MRTVTKRFGVSVAGWPDWSIYSYLGDFCDRFFGPNRPNFWRLFGRFLKEGWNLNLVKKREGFMIVTKCQVANICRDQTASSKVEWSKWPRQKNSYQKGVISNVVIFVAKLKGSNSAKDQNSEKDWLLAWAQKKTLPMHFGVCKIGKIDLLIFATIPTMLEILTDTKIHGQRVIINLSLKNMFWCKPSICFFVNVMWYLSWDLKSSDKSHKDNMSSILFDFFGRFSDFFTKPVWYAARFEKLLSNRDGISKLSDKSPSFETVFTIGSSMGNSF